VNRVKRLVRTSGRRPLPADRQVKQRAATDDRATLRRDATIAERATARQVATIADLEQAAAETDQTLADADDAYELVAAVAHDRVERAEPRRSAAPAPGRRFGALVASVRR
jgi:hypothetical protein